MNIAETLKFFRQKKNLSQSEAKPKDMSQPAYSSIERGDRSITMKELQEYLDNTSISPNEFFSFSDFDKKQNEFKKVFYTLSASVSTNTDTAAKKELIDYYNFFNENKWTNQRYLANYISIKHFYSQYLNEIEQFNSIELDLIFDNLYNKQSYFYYDYQILSSVIGYLHPAKAENILTKMIPLSYINQRDTATISQAYAALNNIISVSIYSNMFKQAKRYLEIAEKNNMGFNEYKFKLDLMYLENLLLYLETGKSTYLSKIDEYKDIIKKLGMTHHLKQIETEMKLLTFEKNPQKLLEKYNVTLMTPSEYNINQ
ncbi:helix-turn-helix domain-containing protein [Enterococcus termitis]|uniref:HTH cro/C1-type domain-containing protein n=1 Tax=Enterococcus termitis TaxID=332950 RepID=A0A1E5H1D3_9ENTE|nr:helix-turn-helix transcriptional regulator [Enterococcus termitis]OEG18716.1 hypothetical protein BCR25_16075 [Enterococcus termitis]OJG97561.1 hypothetical protein RV18_GL000629 [Enterococcus termitis]